MYLYKLLIHVMSINVSKLLLGSFFISKKRLEKKQKLKSN